MYSIRAQERLSSIRPHFVHVPITGARLLAPEHVIGRIAIPTTTEWGLVALTLMILCVGTSLLVQEARRLREAV